MATRSSSFTQRPGRLQKRLSSEARSPSGTEGSWVSASLIWDHQARLGRGTPGWSKCDGRGKTTFATAPRSPSAYLTTNSAQEAIWRFCPDSSPAWPAMVATQFRLRLQSSWTEHPDREVLTSGRARIAWFLIRSGDEGAAQAGWQVADPSSAPPKNIVSGLRLPGTHHTAHEERNAQSQNFTRAPVTITPRGSVASLCVVKVPAAAVGDTPPEQVAAIARSVHRILLSKRR